MARGPAYPFIGLEQAVSLTRQLYDYSKRTPANLNAVLKEKWEYSPTSSSASKIIAALKYFGLAELAQSGDKSETIKITDRAYRILVDTAESPERKQALRDACLSPKAYKMCWDKWGAEMPASMRSSLIFDEGFIDNTVDGFLSNYRKSLQFAGLLDSLEAEKQDFDDDTKETSTPSGARIESSLATRSGHQQPTPQVPMASEIVRPPLSSKGVGMRQEIFTVAEGDVTIQWPERLSADSLEDFKDWLHILERKITRSALPREDVKPSQVVDKDDDPLA